MTTAPATRPATRPVPEPDQGQRWLTAQVRPAGTFGAQDVGRLRALLEALSASASMVVLDLGATLLRGPSAARVIDDAAGALEARGGCLICINADDDCRACLAGCTHALLPPRTAGTAALSVVSRRAEPAHGAR